MVKLYTGAMIAFGHTAVGSAIGIVSYHYLRDQSLASGLLLTGTLAFGSHYIADFLPHGHFFRTKKLKEFNQKIPKIIFLDLFLSLVLFISVAFFHNDLDSKFWYILFGIGGSQLPDVLDGLIFKEIIPKKGLFKVEYNFHQLVHWHGREDKALLWSIFDIWQVIVVLISLSLIFFDV